MTIPEYMLENNKKFENMNKIKIFKMTESAKSIEKADEDMCYDFFSDEPVKVEWGKVTTIKTGIKLCPPKGYHYSLRPRSGLAAKHGIIVLAGQMDHPYRGEVIVALSTVIKDYVIIFPAGSKIVQAKFERDATFEVVEVKNEEDLGTTNRGEKGFGSSGS